MSTFCIFKWFPTTLYRFYMKLTNASEPFLCKSFFTKIVFLQKIIFLLNHTSWVYFLDYMSLPYHFGKLWMSTFNCFQWFFTKAKRIHVIPTNTRELFFGPDLNNELTWTQYLWKTNHRILHDYQIMWASQNVTRTTTQPLYFE